MRRTIEDSLITKKQIIEVAVELFLQNGFSTTTLDDIAQQSNLTRGAIYWHFTDKLDIVNDLIKEEHEKFAKLLSDWFSDELSPFNKTQNIIEEIVKHFFDNKSFRDFIELTWFKIEYTQLSNLKTAKAELTGYFINNFKLLIKEAQSIGEIKNELNSSDVAATVTNMINGMYRLYFILPDRINNKEEALSPFISYLNLIKTR